MNCSVLREEDALFLTHKRVESQNSGDLFIDAYVPGIYGIMWDLLIQPCSAKGIWVSYGLSQEHSLPHQADLKGFAK